MSAIGGSIQEVSINGRTYAVAADAEAQIKRGGFENEKQSNGNGSARTVMTRVTWSVTGISLEIDDVRNDAEEIQAVADMPEDVPISITMASGVVLQGTGTVTGENATSSQSATMSVELMGPGKLTQQ